MILKFLSIMAMINLGLSTEGPIGIGLCRFDYIAEEVNAESKRTGEKMIEGDDKYKKFVQGLDKSKKKRNNDKCPCGFALKATTIVRGETPTRYCGYREYCQISSFGGYSCGKAELAANRHNTCRSINGCPCGTNSLSMGRSTRYCSFGQMCEPGKVGYKCTDVVPELQFKCPDRDDLNVRMKNQDKVIAGLISQTTVPWTDCVCGSSDIEPSSVCKPSKSKILSYKDNPKIILFRPRTKDDNDLRKFATTRKGVIHANQYFNAEESFEFAHVDKDDARLKNFYGVISPGLNTAVDFPYPKDYEKDKMYNDNLLYDLYIASDHYFDDLGILRGRSEESHEPSIYDQLFKIKLPKSKTNMSSLSQGKKTV